MGVFVKGLGRIEDEFKEMIYHSSVSQMLITDCKYFSVSNFFISVLRRGVANSRWQVYLVATSRWQVYLVATSRWQADLQSGAICLENPPGEK